MCVSRKPEPRQPAPEEETPPSGEGRVPSGSPFRRVFGSPGFYWISGGTLSVAAAVLLVLYWPEIRTYLPLLLDKPNRFKAYVLSWGPWAPAIFTGLQILQVVFAPIPGEATGFLGGYIFGFLPGFFYSSVGLTVGSWLNLLIGRYLGRRIVTRILPENILHRFDHLIRVQTILVVFVLFVIPGFPKDYLCLLLGMSRLPLRLLLVTAAVGRIPGTLVLSLEGASLFAGRYLEILIVSAAALAILGPAYLFRNRIYRWAEQWERGRTNTNGAP